ncbi:hypothetical protein Agub_g1504 [Astrephomene gubernaculifera]|uniref:Uncharacterized protein n=1 Tax=Astrephomene gubernaculifera TaxID=47775 RepID=A0AAD3DGJ2_9CHLO|nr:hypothetical protein Agub_g1504 [Astrephomene gubernaculifera]
MLSLRPKLCGGQLGLRACRAPTPVACIHRPARRCFQKIDALYHNPGPRDSGRAKGAQQSLQRVLDLVQSGERDALVDYFATSNLTDTPSLRLASGCEVMVFEDVLERMLLQFPSRHFLDSYAIRHLILSSPASTQVLSGLMLGPNKYVQRMSVTSPSGESCILTFTMTATQPSQPPAPTAGTAAAAAPSEPVWRLSSVRGEPLYGSGSTGAVQPSGPSPELSPEQIVEAQLAALQRKDVSAAFRFLSPASQKIMGDERTFAENLARHRRYGGLLGHMSASSVRRCVAQPRTYMEIVSVTSASGTRFVFCYILSLDTHSQQPSAFSASTASPEGATSASSGPEAAAAPPDAPTSGETHGSAVGPYWAIDFVKVVDDPRLLAAVENSRAAQQQQRRGQGQQPPDAAE